MRSFRFSPYMTSKDRGKDNINVKTEMYQTYPKDFPVWVAVGKPHVLGSDWETALGHAWALTFGTLFGNGSQNSAFGVTFKTCFPGIGTFWRRFMGHAETP